MSKARKRGSKYYRIAAMVLAGAVAISAMLVGLRLWERYYGKFPDDRFDDSVIEYDGVKYASRDNIETVLFIGLDKFSGESAPDSYNNDKQADFLLLLVLDNDAKTCSAVHINRDTMANVQVLDIAGDRIGMETKQIALAHTYGNGREVSCRNTADAVSDLLQGVNIDHFMSVTMDSVPIYNDLLGGVEVEVLADFGDIDPALIKGERVTLMGQQALTYVRARQGMEDESNLARMERQRQYMNALLDKSLSRGMSDESFVVESTLKMAEYIVSDRSLTQLQELFEKLTSYERTPIVELEGELKVVDGFNQFSPDRKSLELMVIDLFYEVKD